MVSGFSCSEFLHCLKFRVLLKPSLKLFQKSFTPEIWLNRFHFSFFHILVIRISINIENISYMFHIFSSKKTITCFMSKFPPISPPFSFFNRICTDIIYYLRLNLPLIIIFNKWNLKGDQKTTFALEYICRLTITIIYQSEHFVPTCLCMCSISAAT